MDVLVKVDKIIFPVDFVILDVDDDVGVPLIIGRRFLATSQALIDVSNGKMILRVGDEEVMFPLSVAIKHSLNSYDSCFYLDVTDLIIVECVWDLAHHKPFEESLDDLQEEDIPLLHNKSKTEVQSYKKQ